MNLRRNSTCAVIAVVCAACSIEPADDGASLESFVRQLYYEGVQYADAMRFDPTATPSLMAMLEDPSEEPYWGNIAIVLGIVGDERAADALIAFIEKKPDADLSDFQVMARTAAVLGLGYHVNRTGSERALDYLIGGLDPTMWSRRSIAWRASYHATTVDRNRSLARQTMLALALTGHAKARRALLSLKEPGPNAEAITFRGQVRELVDLALDDQATIAEKGLEQYYRQNAVKLR